MGTSPHPKLESMSNEITRLTWEETKELDEPVLEIALRRSSSGPIAIISQDQNLSEASEWVGNVGLSGIGIISHQDSSILSDYLSPALPEAEKRGTPSGASPYPIKSISSAVCLVQTNDYVVTRRCILSLRAAGVAESQIFLLDNGSSDKSGAKLWATFPELTMVRSLVQLPYCQAFNSCASVATRHGASELLILNNDIFDFSANFLEILRENLSGSKVFSSPSLLDCDSSTVVRGGAYPAFGFTHEFGTECFLVRASVWIELGGFREGFQMYGEDLDLLFRARAAFQATGVFSETATIRHDCGMNTQRGRLNHLRRYALRMRNLVWLHRTYSGRATHSMARTVANYLLGIAKGQSGLIALLWSLVGVFYGFSKRIKAKETKE
jgi:GT2 family glycosyltransferase